MSAAYARYRDTQDADASGPEVLLRLYDGMVLHLARARRAIDEKRWADKGKSVNVVINVLGELRLNLDHQVAPDLCTRLDALYDYFGRRVLHASMTRDVTPLDEVAKHLTSLRASWAKVCAKAR